MITNKQQQKAREILLAYTMPDALKPQYDGMTAWELAGIILREAEIAGKEEEIESVFNGEEAPETVDAVVGVGDEMQTR